MGDRAFSCTAPNSIQNPPVQTGQLTVMFLVLCVSLHHHNSITDFTHPSHFVCPPYVSCFVLFMLVSLPCFAVLPVCCFTSLSMFFYAHAN